MADARALVDHQLEWMAGPGRPSPQRGDEEDGASAEFHVDGTLVAVFASHEGVTEIYALQPRGITIWAFELEPGRELEDHERAMVIGTLDEMGKHVRFPAEPWRVAWPDQFRSS